MKIATWNVNSIRARLDRLLAWLASRQPDVVCLQETKVVDDDFPADELRFAGYQSACHGQKTYNGVAILARTEIADVARGMGDGVDDPQARLIGATVGGLRVWSAYVPNGESLSSPKFAYKREWLARLTTMLRRSMKEGDAVLVCGDVNIAPEDLDVHDPVGWKDCVMCHPEERAAFGRLQSLGLVDLFRHLHPGEAGLYSWWDYRSLSFPKNRGLRIDHVLGTAPVVARATAAVVDRDERKGPQPSDHAPVIVTLD